MRASIGGMNTQGTRAAGAPGGWHGNCIRSMQKVRGEEGKRKCRQSRVAEADWQKGNVDLAAEKPIWSQMALSVRSLM